MPSANTSYNDILSTTIENRSGKMADNLSDNIPLLYFLRKKGKVRPISGGHLVLEELMYNDTSTDNTSSYGGFDTIDISVDSPISAAQFSLKMYAKAVSISGEDQLKNSGREQMIDLMAGRIDAAEIRLRNKIDEGLYGDGTGNGGKDLVGLASMISTTPTTGTYGGIDRATWTFWRNVYNTATTVLGGAATSSNIQQLMNTISLQLVRGSEHADLVNMGSTAYAMYLASLQANQRFASEDMAGAGFATLKYFGGAGSADVILGGGIGGNQTATRIDFINTNFTFFRPHRDRNFTVIGDDRQPVNQDAIVKLIGWAGAFTCSGAQFNGACSIL